MSLKKEPLGLFQHLRADNIVSETIKASRIDLDGISVSGLLMQKLLRDVNATSGGSISDAIRELTREIAALRQEASGIQNELLVLSGRIDVLNTTVGGLETSIVAINTTVNGLETTVGTLSTSVNGLETTVGTLGTTVGGLETTVGTISTTVSGLQTTVGGLQTTVAGNTSDISTIITNLQNVTLIVQDNNEYIRKLSQTAQFFGQFAN